MKLLAQHGFQEGEKINEGLERGVIDGVIYSPRDVSLANLKVKLHKLGLEKPAAVRLLDPQFYAAFFDSDVTSRLGFLVEDYKPFFQTRRRSQLERESQVHADIDRCLEFQNSLELTGIIAPNILIPSSLNSIEAVIAKNFVRLARDRYDRLKNPRPLYATLAISREALQDRAELVEFLNELTLLDDPPHGFYLLVAARNTEARSDLFDADVVSRWMLINHVLKINGFEVINGYSDLLTPMLAIAGADAGAFGWWSNLRSFSLDRFSPSAGGGRLPIVRYLSNPLLNRITFYEYAQLRQLGIPVQNGLPTDSIYNGGGEPPRNKEVLQSWDAVRELNGRFSRQTQLEAIKDCQATLNAANLLYESIPVRLEEKSNNEHIPALLEGLRQFTDLAEL